MSRSKVPEMPPLDKGCSKYGAQMGRVNLLPSDKDGDIKLRMVRLPFDDCCYDKGGAYWGMPANVYRAVGEASDEQFVEVFVRGETRERAKKNVRLMMPNARFWR